jgi:hypothetical protein
MHEARTIGVSIRRPWRELYEAIWRPEFFLNWASGLTSGPLERDGDRWKAEGPEGAVRIRFTDRNDFGIMDHYVETGDGQVVYVPMRILANAEGAEALLTLFRQPGMTDEKYEADAAWVERDLKSLKALVEG